MARAPSKPHMPHRENLSKVLRSCATATLFLCRGAQGDTSAEVQQELRLLREQNAALQEQLRQQGALIEALTRKVNQLEQATARYGPGLQESKGAELLMPPTPTSKPGQVSISGEGAVGYYVTQREGYAPEGEFRMDEARLFVEAQVLKDVYFYSELNLITPESQDLSVQLGECYVDVENISKLWHRDGMLNLRMGRMQIPYGEEYLYRYAIQNPLINRSVTDLWGVDEGVELYGALGKLTYVVAVQNGGDSGVSDFTADKALSGRIGFDPRPWLHLSVSGMRTGNLQPPGDYWSALWVANGWFAPIGSTNTTQYQANLAQGDVTVRWPHGYVKAFGGWAQYNDNDPLQNNQRNLFYYSAEVVQDVWRRLYFAARFSEILAPGGYPLPGLGDMGDYYFSGTLTDQLWRLSLGLGYRWSPNFITKAEYSFEQGREVGGEKRDHEDFFGLQAAFAF